MPVETGRLPPGLAQGERLSSLGLRLEQVATPDEHEQAEDLGGCKREGRPTSARLGERVFEDHQRFVEVSHRQDGDRRDEEGARGVVPHERPLGKRSTRDRHDLRCRLAGAGIVVREQGEQHPLSEGPRGRSFSDGLEQLEGVILQGGREQVVGDQPGLEQALELRVGAVEVGQRLRKDCVRLLAPEEVELAAEQERDLGLLERIVDQIPRSLQVLNRRLAADPRLGRAELDQHFGALGGMRGLVERAAQIGDRALGSPACARTASGLAQRRHTLRPARRRTPKQLRGDALRLGARGG